MAYWEEIMKELDEKERHFINVESIKINPQGEIEYDELEEQLLEEHQILHPKDLNHRESLRQSYGCCRHLILTHRTLTRLGLLNQKSD